MRARPVPLAEFTRMLGFGIGKQPAPRGFGLGLLGAVRALVALVFMRPGLTASHHPLAHIGLLRGDTRQ